MSADDPFRRLVEIGIESRGLRIDVDRFWREVSGIGERRQELSKPTDAAIDRVEELIEQFMGLELLDIGAQDVVIDMAAGDSPMPSLLARRANATCRQEASGAISVGMGTPGTSIRMPDAYADKIVVQGSFDEADRGPDGTLLTEVARVLRPGGTAAAFMPLHAAPTLQHGVLELATTAGLTVTVYLLVNVADVHPRAAPLLGLVLRKQAAFEVLSARDDDGRAPAWTPSTETRRDDSGGVLPAGLQSLLPLVVVAVAATGIAIMTFGDLNVPVLRPAFALLFLLTCPGLVLAHALRLPDRLAELTVGVALSIAFNTILVSALLLAGTSSKEIILTTLLLVTFAALVIDLNFGGRGTRADNPS